MKSILLIADTIGWIFHRHCDEIKKRITEYNFDIKFTWQNSFTQEDYDRHDIIYLLDPMGVNGVQPPKRKTVIGLRNEFMYDHTFPGIMWFYKSQFESRCSMYHVVNRKQYREFSSIPVSLPLLLVQHGIDTSCFMIKNKKKINNDQLIIGISGNRSSSGDKGFDLVEEACRITNSQLITSKQDLSSGHLSKEQMSDYYNKLDIYCCMSKSEGLNNCIMEAGATAVPVITTRTGAVEEMIEDGKTGFIIERNVQALVDKINFFKNNREAIKTFGNDFKKIIDDNWSWDSKIEDYRKMFNMFFINLV